MRVKLIDVDNRLNIKYSKNDEIYNWGDDNAYPSLIKSLIGSSVTARQCSDLNSKYIFGKGFEFAGKTTIINKDGLTLNQLLRVASKEFADQNNLFFHVNYNALFEVISVKLIPCTDGRVWKTDSTGYSGKFVVYDNWDRSKGKSINKKDFVLIDRFNPQPSVIEAQVEASGGWSKYKGQILHIKSDFSSIYSLSDADSVLNRMYSEASIGDYGARGFLNGYFGKHLVTTPPFNDDSERDEFEKCLYDLQGVDSKRNTLLLEANQATDDLTKQINIQALDDGIDADKFEKVADRVAREIRKAFGVPAILIEDSDNSIFGNSGELIIQAKKMHWENKEEERQIVQEAFQTIFSRWHEPINPENNWEIIPLITLSNTATNE